MSTANIQEELSKLPTTERLNIIEATLRAIRQEMQHQKPSSFPTTQQRLESAAEALLSDYLEDEELTSFTALDGEEFHA